MAWTEQARQAARISRQNRMKVSKTSRSATTLARNLGYRGPALAVSKRSAAVVRKNIMRNLTPVGYADAIYRARLASIGIRRK